MFTPWPSRVSGLRRGPDYPLSRRETSRIARGDRVGLARTGARAGLSLVAMISGIARKEVPTEAKVRVGDERLLKVSADAGDKVRSLLERQGRPEGVLRVAVVGGGCSGLQYRMDLQDAPAHRDILVESGGIRVVVDPKTALYVTGSQLDYADKLEDGGFKVNNPNAASTCSCGESFSA